MSMYGGKDRIGAVEALRSVMEHDERPGPVWPEHVWNFYMRLSHARAVAAMSRFWAHIAGDAPSTAETLQRVQRVQKIMKEAGLL